MKRRQGLFTRAAVVVLLTAVTPLSMGGCANEFQDSALAAIETAFHAIADAAVTQLFSPYTSN